MKKLVGAPQFHTSVFYAYNERLHTFFFYTPIGGGRELVPVGMFSPMTKSEIPYDPQAMVEMIADQMSREDGSYDFELDEE